MFRLLSIAIKSTRLTQVCSLEYHLTLLLLFIRHFSYLYATSHNTRTEWRKSYDFPYLLCFSSHSLNYSHNNFYILVKLTNYLTNNSGSLITNNIYALIKKVGAQPCAVVVAGLCKYPTESLRSAKSRNSTRSFADTFSAKVAEASAPPALNTINIIILSLEQMVTYCNCRE